MGHVLVVYGTRYGHTESIMDRVTEILVANGHEVTAVAATADLELVPSNFDGAILASSIVMTRHHPALVAYAKRHHEALDAIPSAFVSVCMHLAEGTEQAKAEAHAWVEAFEDNTGWHPAVVEELAGALDYTRYNFLVRFLMKQIAKKMDASTDTTVDHDYTDWAEVERFARAFAALVEERAAA